MDDELTALLTLTRVAAWQCAVRSVAHALGTPLNVVLGHSELLLEETPESLSAASIIKQVRTMESLLGRSIEFPIELLAGNDSSCDARELWTRVSTMLAPRISERGVTVNFETNDEPFPRASGLMLLLALTRFGVERASSGSRVVVRCTRSSSEACVGVFCPVDSRFAGTIHDLCEPWFSEPVDASIEGLELAAALGVCRRLGGRIELARDPDALRLALSWPLSASLTD